MAPQKKERTEAQKAAWAKCVLARNEAIKRQMELDQKHQEEMPPPPEPEPVAEQEEPEPQTDVADPFRPPEIELRKHRPIKRKPTPMPVDLTPEPDYDLVDLDDVLQPLHEKMIQYDEIIGDLTGQLRAVKEQYAMHREHEANMIRFV
jgi:hypothetical protein